MKYGQMAIKSSREIFNIIVKMCKKEATIITKSTLYVKCDQSLKTTQNHLSENESHALKHNKLEMRWPFGQRIQDIIQWIR